VQEILKHLKKHGQCLDTEIAVALGIPLEQVQLAIADMAERGEISKCTVTRFNGAERTEGILCRVAGFIPQAGPGRKPGALPIES
jgi:transcription initiation factor IIE alpha subunit